MEKIKSMDRKIIVIIISVILIAASGLSLFLEFTKESSQLTSRPLIPPPVIPDLSEYSEEELIELWANGERCPRTKIGFAIPSKPEDFVSTGGAQFAINEVEVDFIKDATCEDAEQIALFLNGRIVGFEPVTNLYGIEIPTRTIEELFAAIDKVNSLNNPKIEGVFEAVVLPHGGN